MGDKLFTGVKYEFSEALMSYDKKVLSILLFMGFCGAVNGVVIGFLDYNIVTGIVGSIVTMLVIIIAVSALVGNFWIGTLNDLSGLNKTGSVVYEIMPLIDRGQGCELMHIAENGRRHTEAYYAINTNLIRGGAEAIPKDGTPFKLIEGTGYDDIVVVKVPKKEESKNTVLGHRVLAK